MPQKIKWLVDNLFANNKQNSLKNSQQQFEESSEKIFSQLNEVNFQTFIENLPVMFYAVESAPPFSPIYFSSNFETFGYLVEELRNDPTAWLQTIHTEDFEWVKEAKNEAIKTGKDLDIEYRIIGKDKKVHWICDQGRTMHDDKEKIICFQGIIIDISEHKKAEQEIIQRKELYRIISRNIPNTGIILFDHDLRLTLAEGEELEKMGLTAEVVEGKTIFEVFPKETAHECARYYRGALAGGFISVEREYQGSIFQTYILPLKNEKKDIYGGMSIWQNITDRKRKDQKLKESEKRYRELFEGANDLIYIHDLSGNFLSMNKAAERVFGYTQEEILKLDMKRVVAPDHLSIAAQMMEKKIKNNLKQTVYELNCLTKEGKRVTLEINSSLIYENDKPVAVQGIARDITERKISEQRLQESEAELRALFSAMDDLIIVFDREGRYLKIPPTNPSSLVTSTKKLIGKRLHDVFPKEKADLFVSKIKESLETQSSINIEYSLELRGETRWFSSMISPMSEDCVVTVARDITTRKLAEVVITENEERYRELFENANDLIYTIDLEGTFTSLNRAGERISGYTRKEAFQVKMDHVVAPEYLDKARRKIVEKVKGKKSKPYEIEIISKNGHRVSLELSTRVIYKDGKPFGIQGIGRDITDRKKAEEALKLSESQYRLLSEGIMHQVWTAQPDGMLDYVNGRTLEYFGKAKGDLLRESWMEVVHPEDLAGCLERWTYSLTTGEHYETEFRLRRQDGVYRWYRALATAGRDANGKIVKWFGTNTDIHDQKMAEAQLNHFAKHDPLTNLPNRSKFMNQLSRIVRRRDLEPDHLFAVLFLDLDRFKVINDSLGHLNGDKLLVAFAERLESCVRPGDIVARLGGDEFTILLNNLDDFEEAVRITNRLIQKLSEPFNLGEYEVFTAASVGIVVSDEVKRQPEDYLRDADTAMYRAKEAGKARYEIFNSEMHIRNMTLLRLENDLRRAIERKEFRVFYQPIISLETGEVREFEALIRWQHPEHGLVQPVEFVEVAEETGLIIPIGKWILEEACQQAIEWQKKFPESKPFSVSVNLSSKQLMHPHFIAQVKEVLAETGLNPQSLRLEVTESKVMENSEVALSVLSDLKKIGVSLSTDDFGTGYSSLSYLHRFPFDCLKIDRSFIGQMDSNNKSSEIVRTILMLAQNLKLEAVAEGIETEEQLKQLQLLGCKLGQGFLFSKPIDAQAAERLLSEKSTEFSHLILPNSLQEVVELPEIQ